MSYMHISNLYSPSARQILLFRECYALEKVHGTSAHIAWKQGKLTFSSGGASEQAFKALFNEKSLTEELEREFGSNEDVTIYGEAYGGKMQKMSDTYGPDLRFIVFDVQTTTRNWSTVPEAKTFAERLGLEFVPYALVSTDLQVLDTERDKPSEVAVRRGCGSDKQREGVVLRPLVELNDTMGERIICKHKTANFRETKSVINVVDPAAVQVLADAQAVASEWVVAERLRHVLDKLQIVGDPMKSVGKVIAAMLEDVKRESNGMVVWSKEVEKAVSKATVELYRSESNSIVK